ncbi:MAG: MFS transporter [Methylovulum sp.]|nr:MFS transporter [Methylovulum sp.]
MTIPYWRLSGFYFFYFAALGGFTPYWGLYLKDIGFNAAQIGELFAVLAGTKIISPNLFGWIADHTQKSMPIIRTASLLSALLCAAFLVAHSYFWIVLITASFSFFWHAALPQFEAITLFHLKEEPHRYSQIRLWGSIGFIVAVLGIGRLLDSQPIGLLPIAITALLALMGLTTLIVPEARAVHHEKNTVGILQIIKKPEVIAFFIVGMLLQLAHTPYYVFYSIYLNQHHYSATLTGGLWTLGIVAEIVLFLYMKRVLARFSLRTIFLFSIALAAIRWLVIAWCADDLGFLILAQLLHAATFGGVHVAAIHLLHRYFGRQHQGKGQALYGSLCYGLGGVLGSFYGGYYWDSAGAVFVYSIAAMACVIAWPITYFWIGREVPADRALG